MATTKYPGIERRTLPNGAERFDVRYRLPSGQARTKTVRTITEARQFQATTKADRARGGLVDPKAGRLTLTDYASDWIDTRAALRPRTVDHYEALLRLHIAPTIGKTQLGKLDPAGVRAWHSKMVKAAPTSTTPAKAYRLLRAVLNTAVSDGRILSNPCSIKGGGAETHPERPTVSPAEVRALADAVAQNRRCMVLLAGFLGLRLGEVLGLAVRHVDLLHGTITVERQLQEAGKTGEQILTGPKSEKGRRVLPMPALVATAMRAHLERLGETSPEAFLFTGAKGGPLRRYVWQNEWSTARSKAGHPTLRFHDLRHSALTLYAATGATIAELQAHAGHASPEAAMRYQHATKDRAAALAALVDRVIAADQGTPSPVRLVTGIA